MGSVEPLAELVAGELADKLNVPGLTFISQACGRMIWPAGLSRSKAWWPAAWM